MAPRNKLADLGALRDALKEQAIARERAVAQAALEAKQRADEADLFRTAVGDLAPLVRPPNADLSIPRPAPIPLQHLADEQRALAQALSDDFDVDSLLDTDGDLSWIRPPLGPDVVRKLRRGHWVIQDQLDLHGARTDEARELLGEFLRDSTRRGLRCVRVIHGKGLGSKDRQPVLKGKVRRWLVQRDDVIAFCQARGSDGGAGALVVLLRAAR